MKTIKELQEIVHSIALQKKWYDKDHPRSIGDCIALMHSELSEALEEYRSGRFIDEVYYSGDKPLGFPIELADCIIRILDFCEFHNINLEEAINTKNIYNQTRPDRHGGKKI